MSFGLVPNAEIAVLDALVRATPPVANPTSLYLALYIDHPWYGGTEVTGASYARQAITFSYPVGTYPAVCKNSNRVSFGIAPESWGNVNYLALIDNNEMMWYAGQIDMIPVPAGMHVFFEIGSLMVTRKSSAFSEALILNYVLRGVVPAQWPSTVYLAFYTGNPLIGGLEVSSGGYQRRAVSFNAAASAEPSICSNNGAVNYGIASADWGILKYFAVMDAQTSGNILYAGRCTDAAIYNGTSFTVADQQINVQED